ncbi:uncharacterized protein [Triticum aestivum]|uniref:uncharacterized protein n=1 Tax=Triticum aestivum TaxID=4565 RepID=UPI001D0121F9|nr:uncharacterized protein LOC123041262 [Triticum aestivum]
MQQCNERIQWWCLDSAEMLLSTKESMNLVPERGCTGHKKSCLDLRRHSHVATDPSVSVPGALPCSSAAIRAESAPSSVVDLRPLHASCLWCARHAAPTRCTGYTAQSVHCRRHLRCCTHIWGQPNYVAICHPGGLKTRSCPRSSGVRIER